VAVSGYSKSRETVYMLLCLFGAGLMFYGLFLAWPPLGFVVLGVFVASAAHDLWEEEKSKQ